MPRRVNKGGATVPTTSAATQETLPTAPPKTLVPADRKNCQRAGVLATVATVGIASLVMVVYGSGILGTQGQPGGPAAPPKPEPVPVPKGDLVTFRHRPAAPPKPKPKPVPVPKGDLVTFRHYPKIHRTDCIGETHVRDELGNRQSLYAAARSLANAAYVTTGPLIVLQEGYNFFEADWYAWGLREVFIVEAFKRELLKRGRNEKEISELTQRIRFNGWDKRDANAESQALREAGAPEGTVDSADREIHRLVGLVGLENAEKAFTLSNVLVKLGSSPDRNTEARRAVSHLRQQHPTAHIVIITGANHLNKEKMRDAYADICDSVESTVIV